MRNSVCLCAWNIVMRSLVGELAGERSCWVCEQCVLIVCHKQQQQQCGSAARSISLCLIISSCLCWLTANEPATSCSHSFLPFQLTLVHRTIAQLTSHALGRVSPGSQHCMSLWRRRAQRCLVKLQHQLWSGT